MLYSLTVLKAQSTDAIDYSIGLAIESPIIENALGISTLNSLITAIIYM